MKKLLILFLCLTMFILSACAPENTDTTELDLSNHNPSEENNSTTNQNNTTGALGLFDFETIDFLKKTLIAAAGTEEEFDLFCSQAPASSFLGTTFRPLANIRALKEKVLITNLPFPKVIVDKEFVGCQYHYPPSSLSISYRIDDIRYFFDYYYDSSQLKCSEKECELFTEDYRFGPYTMDLHIKSVEENTWYHGVVPLDNAKLLISFHCGTQTPPDSIDLFEFKVLDLTTQTENENTDDTTTDDTIMEGPGMEAVGFESIEQIREVLIVCEKSEEEYKEFLTQMHRGHASQDIIRHWKTLLSSHDFPFVKDDKNTADFLCTYYYTFQDTTVFYSIDGIQYKLMYFYNEAKYTPLEGDLAVTDYHIGSYTLDLYQNGENNYFGRIDLNENVILHIDIRSDHVPPDAGDLFEFKPLDLSVPTE